MDSLKELETLVQQIVETQIEIGIMIHDFEGSVDAKDGLSNRIRVLVEQYKQLHAKSPEFAVQVPIDVIEYIENGRNPDIYSREFVELVAKQNQYVNGKMKAMRTFQAIFAADIKQAYPDLDADVDDVLKRTEIT